MKNTISGATADVQAVPTPVAESDAETILDDVEAFEPTIIDVLSAIVTKKPLFDALPLGGVSTLVASDLVALNSTTWEFGAALIAATPVSLMFLLGKFDLIVFLLFLGRLAGKSNCYQDRY